MAPAADRLRDEGADWVLHILSGKATRADAEALARWRARSPEHEAAYGEAVRMWRAVDGAAPAWRARQADKVVPLQPRRTAAASVDRRLLMGGGIAASVAAAVFARGAMLGPVPDYRTGKGERRELALGGGLDVELNTLTSLSVRPMAGGRRLQLFNGQAIVNAALGGGQVVELQAGGGRATARQAHFDVRHDDGDRVCVTCLSGEVQVEAGEARVQLAANQQVAYGKAGMGRRLAVDPAVVTAWQSGMLIFHNQPLSAVIAEVNRYRPGRIILGDEALAHRPVEAVFYLDRMQDVVVQVQELSGAHAAHLPGGVVVLT